jgi:hypothetical protein
MRFLTKSIQTISGLRVENVNVLMPHEKPPTIFRTTDNIEYKFLQTFSNFDKMEKFRQKNHCQTTKSKKNGSRIRYYCMHRYKMKDCKFTLLAVKTTKKGYHVYKHGEHKHNKNCPAKRSDKFIFISL